MIAESSRVCVSYHTREAPTTRPVVMQVSCRRGRRRRDVLTLRGKARASQIERKTMPHMILEAWPEGNDLRPGAGEESVEAERG